LNGKEKSGLCPVKFKLVPTLFYLSHLYNSQGHCYICSAMFHNQYQPLQDSDEDNLAFVSTCHNHIAQLDDCPAANIENTYYCCFSHRLF
ncbi:MAG: hypothetical protein ACR2KZ_04745, partial [Segetibacter sp.]